MTRALVVHRDARVAAGEVEALRSLGYDVDRCPGPTRCACPLVRGCPCPRVERADILVYDLASLRFEADRRELGEELRELYADKPLVVLAGGSEPGALEPGALELVEPGDGVVWLFGPASADRLALIVEDGLAAH
jgi:hypothetical protein